MYKGNRIIVVIISVLSYLVMKKEDEVVKKIIIFLCVIFVSLNVNSSKTSAEVLYTNSSKVWTVALNLPVLNDESNLTHIKLFNSDGEEVQINVKVKNTKKDIEVQALELLEKGKYQLKIEKGLMAENSWTLADETIHNFEVNNHLSSSFLVGEWQTEYTNNGIHYDLDVIFKSDGTVDMRNLTSSGMYEYAYGKYSVEQGNLNMKINNPMSSNPNDVFLELNGQIGVYKNTKIKVVSASGKEMEFIKISDRLSFQ